MADQVLNERIKPQREEPVRCKEQPGGSIKSCYPGSTLSIPNFLDDFSILYEIKGSCYRHGGTHNSCLMRVPPVTDALPKPLLSSVTSLLAVEKISAKVDIFSKK